MGGGYFRDDEMDRLTKLAAACLSHKLDASLYLQLSFPPREKAISPPSCLSLQG